MQEKVDKIKGQMREMKRWHSQQLLARRSQGQLDALAHEMSNHISFGTLPMVRPSCKCVLPMSCSHHWVLLCPQITEGRSNVTVQSPGLLAPRKRVQRVGRCDECGRKTGISSSFPCRLVRSIKARLAV